MHEVGIMQTALEIAERQAQAAGATRIEVVRLRVGQLTAVVPEALEHAFAVLRQGTLAETAQLEVDYVPALCWCHVCGQDFETPGPYSDCPRCGTPSLDVRRGRELELVSLEVD